jgi:hypothetical protein
MAYAISQDVCSYCQCTDYEYREGGVEYFMPHGNLHFFTKNYIFRLSLKDEK